MTTTTETPHFNEMARSRAVVASNPRQSDCCPDRPNARDVDVTVTIDGREIRGEVTLLPDPYDGEYRSWGESPDYWVSGGLLAELTRAGALDALSEIEAEAAAAIGGAS